MVNEEHYTRLNKGVQSWNEWRANNLNIILDLTEANLKEANLTGANLSEANLTYSDLTGANLNEVSLVETNLTGANLTGANLREANLHQANLHKADLISVEAVGADLSGANLTGANLTGVDFSGAYLLGVNLSVAYLSDVFFMNANLSGANLSGANLSGANLSGANLIRADLTSSDLRGTNLNGADLIRTQALGTDFTNAKFTGACLEDWNINSATKLNDIDCQYVYLKRNKQERRPSSGEFAPGEFTKLFQKALETVDLIFRNGIDWQAFLTSYQKLQIESGGEELSIQAIENKNDGTFVIRVNVPLDGNKSEIEKYLKREYELQVKALYQFNMKLHRIKLLE
ncbi:MAG: pentapeptide repeat-containing protein [Nostoc indistinguendum CM1-VF10]|jgi:uncharacterized protein YjbI with pentapeptide repeats|nr:pentapeptide repeat-containing protein [Nostoc indistinguendum CM1-VF10]